MRIHHRGGKTALQQNHYTLLSMFGDLIDQRGLDRDAIILVFYNIKRIVSQCAVFCQNSVLLHLPTCGMFRCRIFSCSCQHVGCYAADSSLALANMWDCTLPRFLLHLPTCMMLCCHIFSCTCQHVGCYAAASSLQPLKT